MHATPQRSLGQRAAPALLTLLLALAAGCTTGSSGRAAVGSPSTTAGLPSASDGGPAVTFTGATPEVAGHRAATISLARFASALPSGCAPSEERSDPHLVSVAWRCGARIVATTVTLDGETLALADFMTGAYQGYLSSVAQQQFQIEGVKDAVTTDLSTWYLTPATLAVVYPAGVVTYPLPSLAPYLRDSSRL